MEKISKETNDCHREILNIATKLYNTTSKNLNESYYKGRKDSYEEILNWILNNCKNERYINPNNFNNLLIEKIAKVKISLKEDDDIENFLSSEKKEKKKFHNKNCYNFSSQNNPISNEHNIFPTSVASVLNNNKSNFHFSSNNTFTQINNNNEEDISMSNSSPISYSPNYNCLKRKKN